MTKNVAIIYELIIREFRKQSFLSKSWYF